MLSQVHAVISTNQNYFYAGKLSVTKKCYIFFCYKNFLLHFLLQKKDRKLVALVVRRLDHLSFSGNRVLIVKNEENSLFEKIDASATAEI